LALAAMMGIVITLPQQLWHTVVPGSAVVPMLLWPAARCTARAHHLRLRGPQCPVTEVTCRCNFVEQRGVESIKARNFWAGPPFVGMDAESAK
jgi:hypothetical protein